MKNNEKENEKTLKASDVNGQGKNNLRKTAPELAKSKKRIYKNPFSNIFHDEK